MDHAISFDDVDFLKELVKKFGPLIYPYHYTAAYNARKVLERLSEFSYTEIQDGQTKTIKYSVNDPDKGEDKPINVAVMEGSDLSTLELLLKLGAEVNEEIISLRSLYTLDPTKVLKPDNLKSPLLKLLDDKEYDFILTILSVGPGSNHCRPYQITLGTGFLSLLNEENNITKMIDSSSWIL